MDNVLEMLYIAFAMFIFCAAVSILTVCNSELNRMIELQKEAIYSNNVLY